MNKYNYYQLLSINYPMANSLFVNKLQILQRNKQLITSYLSCLVSLQTKSTLKSLTYCPRPLFSLPLNPTLT